MPEPKAKTEATSNGAADKPAGRRQKWQAAFGQGGVAGQRTRFVMRRIALGEAEVHHITARKGRDENSSDNSDEEKSEFDNLKSSNCPSPFLLPQIKFKLVSAKLSNPLHKQQETAAERARVRGRRRSARAPFPASLFPSPLTDIRIGGRATKTSHSITALL